MAKPKYVNQPFDEETRKKATDLIEAGKIFQGGFWKNRTKAASRLRYGTWEQVPEQIRLCVNQIGRALSRKGKELKVQTLQAPLKSGAPEQLKLPTLAKFVVTKDALMKIHANKLRVPKNASPAQIQKIREYITRTSGFDPKKMLLGIESHMEK
jgi:hypothetical protein